MEQSKFYQIKNITEHEYTLVGCDGSVITRPIQDVDKSASAFTIQDAKAGDVLVDSLGNVCIYQEPSTKLMYHSYCYGSHKCFIDMGGSHEIVGSSPATKEQRNLLFEKMKEAGYEWDAEKKELRTIENTSNMTEALRTEYERGRADAIAKMKTIEWSEEDNKNLNSVKLIIENSENLNKIFETIDSPEYIKKYFIDWLKSLKDKVQPQTKQKWSKEDETGWTNTMIMIKECASYYYNKGSIKFVIDWLESLKNRCISQPKQEWSEYDKIQLSEAIQMIEANGTWVRSEDAVKKVSNWLKSLKPNYWKPSEEQLNAFEHFVRSICESGYASPYDNNTKLLYSLLNDLKNL